jgi:hypothetical protein
MEPVEDAPACNVHSSLSNGPYRRWLTRLQFFVVFQTKEFVPPEMMKSIRLLLLRFAENNATFTLDELAGQHLSPFQTYKNHGYSRVKNTWAATFLASLNPPNTNELLVWVQPTFFTFLKQCAVCLSAESFLSDDCDVMDGNMDIWINVTGNEGAVEEVQNKFNKLQNSWFHALALKLCGSKELMDKLKGKNWMDQTGHCEAIVLLIKQVTNKAHLTAEFRKRVLQNTGGVHIFRWQTIQCGLQGVVLRKRNCDASMKLIDYGGFRASQETLLLAILSVYPLLFVDLDETIRFFKDLNNGTLTNQFFEDMQTTFANVQIPSRAQLQSFWEEEVRCVEDYDAHDMHVDVSFNLDATIGSRLRGLLSRPPSPYLFYAKIVALVMRDLNNFMQKSQFCGFVVHDILESLKEMHESYQNQNLFKYILAVQSIVDTIPLFYNGGLCITVKDWFLEQHKSTHAPLGLKVEQRGGICGRFLCIEEIHVFPYYMTAFSRVLQSISSTWHHSVHVCATHDSWFEARDLLRGHKNVRLSVLPLESIPETIDVMFVEEHPNNVKASEMYSSVLDKLFQAMENWPCDRQQLLVLDLTLTNIFAMDSICTRIMLAINHRNLGVIVLVSLTKFAQAGLDMQAGGLGFTVFGDKSRNWMQNFLFKEEIKIDKVIDIHQDMFFNFFMHNRGIGAEYLSQIVANSKFVRRELRQRISKFPIHTFPLKFDLISCEINSGIPLIGFSVKELVRDLHCEEDILLDIVTFLIKPLLLFVGFTAHCRASIGFPITNFAIIEESIRVTVGLETHEELSKLIDVFEYVLFCICKIQNLKSLLDGRQWKAIL